MVDKFHFIVELF